MTHPATELVTGGQRSGKSAHAERRAARWLAESAAHRMVYAATAQAFDDEMRERIARHRSDRQQRLPGALTIEEPLSIDAAIRAHSTPRTLVVVDCLTLWLTNLLMPAQGAEAVDAGQAGEAIEALEAAVKQSPGPVILVTNEIGWGVIPAGRDVRRFVDAQGRLNQRMARACPRATLMAAGLPLDLKGGEE